MKTCIILGDRSDLARAMLPFLLADGWTVHGWNRDSSWTIGDVRWDMVLCALGRVAPVGHWWEQNEDDVWECFTSNILLPMQLLRALWANRNEGASVCMLAGSNPNRIMDGYAAYNSSKMALLKLIEQMDHECTACKVFALAPGYVPTKIHKATLDAQWPNERIERGDGGTPIQRIYDTLKWAVAQDKTVIGGRNLCCSDPWDTNPSLTDLLELSPSKYKLRRVE